LAALVPLARFGRRGIDRLQLERAERFLWQHAHLVRHAPVELVGFELLLPALMRLATEAGVHVPPYLDAYAQERAHKLELVPRDKIYSPNATIAHSVEFLGADANLLQLLSMQADNGSIGNSPAATAYLLQHIDDPAAVAYLERCVATGNDSGVPALEPVETYEALWVAYNLYLGGASPDCLLPASLRAQLVTALEGPGVSLSPSFKVPDADDTAVALLLLHEAGIKIDPGALRQFERDEYFVSFPHERHASTGVNIHMLAALTRLTSYPNRGRAIAKILQFLRAARHHERYWLDKWHVSPYYATSHAIVALAELPAPYTQYATVMVDAAAEWIVRTQNADGSWGFYGTPTTEETAYAVLGLCAAPPSEQVTRAIEAGQAYLEANQGLARPALWIDKCLYYPTRIVDSALHAALGRAAAYESNELSAVYTRLSTG
jgi:halimadienyl-diphosphate synthase